MEVKIYDLTTKKYYYEKTSLCAVFLYKTIIGRVLLKIIFTRPWYAKISSYLIKSKISRIKIKSFIKNNKIDISRYENKKYKSFDDFFTRKIKEEKRIFSTNNQDLISVCDAKLYATKIDDKLTLNIKNSQYTLPELLKSDSLSKEYQNGYILVFRLTKDDYHHYYYFDDGNIVSTKKIKGILHTVMPISYEKYKVYAENSREYSLLSTKHFDKVIYMEVGALMIGKINNDITKTFQKNDHKGYFSFGASTIILIFKENQIKIKEEILNQNKKGIEVKVNLGDIIGTK